MLNKCGDSIVAYRPEAVIGVCASIADVQQAHSHIAVIEGAPCEIFMPTAVRQTQRTSTHKKKTADARPYADFHNAAQKKLYDWQYEI